MHLYKNKCFILLFLRVALCISNNELKVSRKGLSDLSHCSIGLQFVFEVNNTSTHRDYDVELIPDECCLVTDGNVDCGSIEMIGVSHGVVPRDSSKSFKLIAPLLEPYQRRGRCTIFLDSTPTRTKHIMRDTVNVNFNTFLDEYNDDVKRCKRTDQDPLNNCKPVDCDTYYNDHKPHYCKRLRKCVNVPTCISNRNMKYPEIIYNPISNTCVDHIITDRDINDIKTLKKRSINRVAKDIVIIRNNNQDTDNVKYNDTYSDSIYDMPPDFTSEGDEPTDDKKPKDKNSCSKPSDKSEKAKSTQKAKCFGIKRISRWTLLFLIMLIMVQCCVICSLAYCLVQKYSQWKKNRDIGNTYYNYNNDASVTTPLINTSTRDTNTNEAHYFSESSENLENKAKHYKTIQKDVSDTVKKSLSDDILSKCINRRNWIRNTKFDSAPNNSINHNLNKEEILEDIENSSDKPQPEYQTNYTIEHSNNSSETKINFENEDSKDLLKTVSSLKESIGKKSIENRLSSEREIKCISYSNIQSNKSSMVYRRQSPKTVGYYQSDNCNQPSIEKSAQAYFSNDSIDDFISERGMIFFAGDDTSKYTLSSDSMPLNPSSSSGVSNKTSKNNIVTNVLSLLRMRSSKHGTNSDPGVKSSHKNLDVQLLHISTNSIYSSSNEMEGLVNCKNYVNESRTSL